MRTEYKENVCQGLLRRLAWGIMLFACLALMDRRVQATVSAGNGIYQVFVQDTPGQGVGLYTATTGPSHPAGNGLNVLFGNGSPATTFNTIRSYSTGTDYVQSSGKTSANPTVLLDPFGTVTPLGSTGFRTTYILPGGSNSPDAMTIVQDVKVNGITFEDSTIEISTTIINNGSNSLSAGVRYFWDYQIGVDDGPTFSPVNSTQVAASGCNVFTTETQFSEPTFTSYRMVDNDGNPHPPTFNIFGTVVGPSTVVPLPTAPDLLQYVCWPRAFPTAFDYTIDPTLDIATVNSTCTPNGGDCAVSYFFGHNINTALTIGPAASASVSASLFLTPISTSNNVGYISRPSRFWFTHQENSDTNCATLRSAVAASCQVLDLGFVTLPNGFANGDNVEDGEDAMLEALGFYWKSTKYTGEIGGTQSSKSKSSSVCVQRKKLAVELIAAIANTQLFGTLPQQVSYVNARTNVFFAANLLDQARATASGADVAAMASMTALLQKFNNGGETNNFPVGITECSPTSPTVLRKLARDPTTQGNCPGVNNSCAAAAMVAFSSTNQFAPAVFTQSVNLNTYTNNFPIPTCGTGGRDAIWKILPTVGTVGRHFTATTAGSNFDTMLSVWSGTCSNPIPVACTNSVSGNGGETLAFNTDGTNTFFIVGEGSSGQFGTLKLRITSP